MSGHSSGGRRSPRVLALSGGVGGARFLDGLARVTSLLPPLVAIVNTGDDFTHWGLHIAPDLDTVMYTLAGLSDEERGWGLQGETWQALEAVRRYGGEDWFALGDRDLGTHLIRSRGLREGRTLSEMTAQLCGALGLSARLLPMADAPRPTMIDTDGEGVLGFQRWFVARRAEPGVRRVIFEGTTTPAPGVIAAIDEADVVLIGPSNPYVSIDPIVTLDGVADALRRRPVIAVSPIVAGAAVKGPLGRMIPALRGEPPTAGAIARHYGSLLAGIVVERGDEDDLPPSLPRLATSTVMRSREDRLRLAEETLAFARTLIR